MPIISNYAKGRFIEWCDFPTGAESIVVVCLKTAVADATATDCQFLSDLFTAGAVECDFTNYIRKVLGSSDVTITTNTSTNFQQAAFPLLTWAAAGGAVNNTSVPQIAIAYQPTSSSNDSATRLICTQNNSGGTNGAAFALTPQPVKAS